MLSISGSYSIWLVITTSVVVLLALYSSFLLSNQPTAPYISDLWSSKHRTDYSLCQAGVPTWSNYTVPSNAQLVHIQLVTRHGDRAPLLGIFPYEQVDWQCNDAEEAIISLDNDSNDKDHRVTTGYIRRVTVPSKKAYPHAIWSSGTCALGQLTRKGIRQHEMLGRHLRDIYIDQLKVLPDQLTSQSWLNSSVRVRSTDTQRTLASASALLRGLWPTTKRDTESQLVPISVYPSVAETMWGQTSSCPRALELALQLRTTSKTHVDMLEQYQSLRHRLEQILGTKHMPSYQNDVRYFIEYMDPLYTRICHEKPLPCHDQHGCITKGDVEALLVGTSESYALLWNSQESAEAAEYTRLRMGYFLGELRDHLTTAIHSLATSNSTMGSIPHFELFSGHDSTIYGLIGALNVSDLRWPPYASNLLFEVWQSDSYLHNDDDHDDTSTSNYFIRILYNGHLLPLSWCNNQSYCPLSVYLNHINSLIPINLLQECKSTKKTSE